MKKAKLKLNQSLDFISLDSFINNEWATISRWPMGIDANERQEIFNQAKIAIYDEHWRLTEMGYSVELISYLN